MKRALVVLAAAVLAALSLAPPAVAADTPVTHTLTGTVITNDEAPDQTAPGCPAGAAWRYTAGGTGILSHLGRVQVVMTHCSYFTGPTTGTFDTGTSTITAANGDQIFLEQHGTFVLYMNDAGELISLPTVDWTVTGGTGRFASATGSGHTYAQSTNVLVPPTITSGTMVGTITYTASDRRS